MRCEQCHALIDDASHIQYKEETDEEKAIVFQCPQCGHTEYQPLIESFWRRLAA